MTSVGKYSLEDEFCHQRFWEFSIGSLLALYAIWNYSCYMTKTKNRRKFKLRICGHTFQLQLQYQKWNEIVSSFDQILFVIEGSFTRHTNILLWKIVGSASPDNRNGLTWAKWRLINYMIFLATNVTVTDIFEYRRLKLRKRS